MTSIDDMLKRGDVPRDALELLTSQQSIITDLQTRQEGILLENDVLQKRITALAEHYAALKGEHEENIQLVAGIKNTIQPFKSKDGTGLVIRGWDVFGWDYPENGIVGGDHITWNRPTRYRFDEMIAEAEKTGRKARINHGEEYFIADKLRESRTKGGVLVADVEDHDLLSALIVPILHQAFLCLCAKDMEQYGTVTTEVFKILSTRFHNTTSIDRLIPAVYAEIRPDGQVKFISLGHPLPFIYSTGKNRFVDLDPKYVTTFPQIGSQPSYDTSMPEVGKGEGLGIPADENTVLEFERITPGDLLFICTDGILDHARMVSKAGRDEEENFFPTRMGQRLSEIKYLDVQTIHDLLIKDFREFAKPKDDYTLVVMRYHGN